MGIFENYLSQIEETVTEPGNITMPEAQVQTDERPRLHTEEELEQFLKPTLIEKAAKAVEEPLRLASTYTGHLYGTGGEFYKTLGYVTGLVGENPVSDMFYKAGGNMELFADQLKKEGYEEGLAGKVYGALGGASFEVPKFVATAGLGSLNLPVHIAASNARMAKETGGSATDQLLAAGMGGIEGALMHGILKANALLPGDILPKASSAAVFYAITPGGVEDKLASALTMAAITGKGTTKEEFYSRYGWGRRALEKRAVKESVDKMLEKASESKPLDNIKVNNEVSRGLKEIETRQEMEPSQTETIPVETKMLRNKDYILSGQLPPENIQAIRDYGLKKFQHLITDVRRNGIKEPIDVIKDKEGNIKIYDGQHRLVAADIVGLKHVPIKVREVEGSVFDFKMKQPTVIEKEAYHVSPIEFNKFDLGKSRKGEAGIDSEGRGSGHYFSEQPSMTWLGKSKFGLVYKTKLKGNMLDFDSIPTELQRNRIRRQLQEEKVDINIDKRWNGDNLYANLEMKLGSAEAASDFLKRSGIDGMKYTDIQMLGKDGLPQKSYIIYNDKAIEILEKSDISKNIFGKAKIKNEGGMTLREYGRNAFQQLFSRAAVIEGGELGKRYKKYKLKDRDNPFLQYKKYLGSTGTAELFLKDGVMIVNQQTGKIETVSEPIYKIEKDFIKETKIPTKTGKAKRVLDKYMEAKRLSLDDRVSDKKRTESGIVLRKITKQYPNEVALLDKTANRYMGYFRNGLLRILKDAGYINDIQIKNLIEKNPYYAPFEHVGNFEKWGAPLKRVDILSEDIESITDVVTPLTYKIVDAAQRNAVKRSMFNLKDIPEFATEIKEIKDVKGREADKNDISVFIDGQKRIMNVSPEIKTAIDSLTPESASMLAKAMAPFARGLQVGITADPGFGLRNFFRDQFTAGMQTDVGYVPFVDALISIGHILGKTNILKEWTATGGSYSGYLQLTRKQIERTTEERFGVKEKLGKRIKKKARPIDTLQKLNQVLENATRLGVYRAAQRKGLIKRFGIGTPPATKQQAAAMSREGTLDFAVVGGKTQQYARTAAFFNPAMQGISKMARVWKNKPLATTLKGVSMLTLPTLLLYLLNRDEPDYMEFSREQRNLNWHFKVGGEWVAVPKPPGWGTMFSSIPERFMEYVDTQDPDAFDGVLRDMSEIVTPFGDSVGNILPTAIKPIMELYANKTFFWGTPIVPVYKEKMPPALQYKQYTPEVLKKLGKEIGMSPVKIQHLIRSWGGKIGKYGVMAIDEGYKILMPSEGKDGIMPKELTDYPVVGSFVKRRPSAYPYSLQKFYKESNRIIGLRSGYKEFMKDGYHQDAKDILKKHPEVRAYDGINKAKQTINKINNAIERTIKLDIPDNEKRKRVLEYERIRLGIAKRMLDVIKRQKHSYQVEPKD